MPEIQTKSDLQAFNNLFGSYNDAKNTIYNGMTDLGEIVARDNFYTSLVKENDLSVKDLGEMLERLNKEPDSEQKK